MPKANNRCAKYKIAEDYDRVESHIANSGVCHVVHPGDSTVKWDNGASILASSWFLVYRGSVKQAVSAERFRFPVLHTCEL